MLRVRLFLVVVCLLVGATLTAAPAGAGLQDFVLVNQTGITIYELYFSPTTTQTWEEDVLGDTVLLDGEQLESEVHDYDECEWDIMAVNEDGDGIYWTEIDLCSISVVTLHCDDESCWATFD